MILSYADLATALVLCLFCNADLGNHFANGVGRKAFWPNGFSHRSALVCRRVGDTSSTDWHRCCVDKSALAAATLNWQTGAVNKHKERSDV